MVRGVLKLAVKSFARLLSERTPPRGRPAMATFEAEACVLIDRVEPGGPLAGPDLGDPSVMDEQKVCRGLEWVLATLPDAYAGDKWCPVACHAMGAIVKEMAGPVLAEMRSARTPDSGDHKAVC